MRLNDKSRRTALAVGVVLSAVGIVPLHALAQDAAATGPIEEIVVTARKREESLQDIPLSVSALSAETIERASIENLEDIAALTAGLTFQSYNGGGLGSPTIRGLAQTDVGSVDNNVGVFVDGVFINNKANLSLNLQDIERVEVVKGPQSALYGNNSFGGAINYVTKRPTNDTTGRVSATVGTDGLFEIGGSLSGSLIDDVLSARVSVNTSQFDGTIDNTLGDNLGGWDKKNNVVLQFEYTPTDALNARFMYYYGDEEYDASAGVILENNCGGELGSPSGLTGRGQTTQRYACGDLSAPDSVTVSPDAFGNRSTTDLGYLNVSYEFANVKLTSLTSYADSDSEARSDQKLNVSDALVAPENRRFTSPFFGTTQTFSQELRLDSFGEGPFNWSVGAFFIDWESDREFTVGTAAAPTAVLNNADFVESEALAFFGLVEYDFNDRWSGSLEARYNSDERDAILTNRNSGATNRFNETFDFTTYRSSVNFTPNDTSLWYGSIARGGKTGGFNNTPIESEQTFDSEFNTTYELGYKATPIDTLTLSVAAYYTTWTDVQLTNPSAVPGNPNVTQNIGDVTSYGLEVDGTWFATEQLSVSFGYAFSDPTFDDGTIDFTHGRRCTLASDCDLSAGPDGGIDVSGQTVDRISQHQFYLSPQYEWRSGNWDYYVRGDIAYQSEQFQRTLNLQTIEGRTIVNGRFGVINDNGLEISVWAKNLTDENYFAAAINEPEFLFDLANFTLYQSTFTTGLLANGRQLGVSVNYNF